MSLIKILKSLSDENRLKILNVINQRTMCVCEIENILDMTQSNVSRHLIKLKDAEIIEIEKRGQFVFHRINLETVMKFPFLKSLLEEIAAKYNDDLVRLNKLRENEIICRGKSCK
jgi:ArsR family transcriptional regulator, arsenate/arsenite/antimonite-responsive transcriptional repressor